jgi:isopropylmalate/homocitrate/citramalate synthase
MKVLLCDVGPRDGLQNELDVLSPELRAELVDRLAQAGLRRIEAVSFVRPDRVPQMVGAEEVLEHVHRREGLELSGLVLNERGWERFAAAGLDRVNVTLAATETFNLRNGNATLSEAIQRMDAILGTAGRMPATVTISCSFGCPFEGRVEPDTVVDLASRFADRAEVVLADTIGVATPSAVRALVARAHAAGFHGHNTRNTGYANCLAALEAGASVLDASVGGLGGCPFSPRATGNVATEDLVYLLEGEGVETGVDLDALVGVSRWLEELLGRTLEGYVYRAGSWSPTATASGGRRLGTSSGRS